MTAAIASAPKGLRSGLRPVNPRKDMPQVADLIEATFAGKLDAGGRRLIREMRTFGRAGWLGWIASKIFLPSAAAPLGFVWEEEGRIVGNASLLEVAGSPNRRVLANVAVHEGYRGRGIGRALVESSLELARRLDTRKLFLQVDQGNTQARQLYRQLGFAELGTWTTWVRSAAAQPIDSFQSAAIRRRTPTEWRAQWLLAHRLYPEGLHWPYPLRPQLFRRPTSLGGLFEGGSRKHWIAAVENELAGSISLFSSQSGRVWRLFLLVHPDWRGKFEQALLTTALADQADGTRSMILDYPVDDQANLLQQLRFQRHRTLTWMAQGLDRTKTV